MLRVLRITLEFLVGFIGILAVLALILVWRLNASPMSSTFLTPYIASGVDRILPGTHTGIGHTLLTWDNVTHSTQLLVDNVVVKNGNDIVIAEIPHVEIQLSLIGMVLGQFLPTELTVEHPQIQLERGADGRVHFGGISAGSGDGGDPREALRSMLQQITHAYFTRKIVINHLVLDLHDMAGNSVWSVSIPDVSLKRTLEGLGGHIALDLTQKENVATLDIHYTYNRFLRRHDLTTHFDNIIPAQLVGGHPESLGLGVASILDLPLSGGIDVAVNDDLKIASGNIQLQGGEGTLDYPDFWDKPRVIKSVEINAAFDRASHRLDVSKATIDMDGPILAMTVGGVEATDATRDLDFNANIHLMDWPADEFDQLWPKPIIPNARDWIVRNISKGTFDDGNVTFKGSLSLDDLENITVASADGTISASHANVKYIDGMPAVENVSADATFDLNQMAVKITGGGIGNLRIVPFTLTMTDLNKDIQYIDIPLTVAGPVYDVMKLIDNPPLNYAKAVGLTPDQITGNVTGEVDLRMPLLKSLEVKDIDIQAKAMLNDLASSKLLKGIDITQGALELNVGKTDFTLKGPATLNGIVSQVTWQQNFEEAEGKPLRQGTVTGTIKDNQWKTLGLDALSGIHGSTSFSLQIVQPTKTTTSLSGNLDFTAADMHVDQVGWKKAAGVPVLLKFSADMPLGKNISIKSFTMHGAQVNIVGNAVLSSEGLLKELKLEPVVIGRTNAAIYYSLADEPNNTLRLEAYGSALDVSGLRGGKDPERSDPRPKEYHIKVDKLYTSDVGFLSGVEGYAIRDKQGWSAISLHGMADGGHKLDIDLTPQGNGRTLSITCDDFGKALKGMGFTDSVRDGDLKIYGASTPSNPRAIEGTVKISHFDVKKLPALMLLLNATTPFGFVGILTDTVSFDRLRGNFRWEGDTIDLKQVEAAGNSVGMNIEGRVDMNSSQAKLNGTLVPFSIVNNVLGSIPVLGDIITGGDGGGVLAVAYNIDGPLNDPKVSVNPVSLLTPGFLRNLFFGGDGASDAPASEGIPLPSAPAATPEAPTPTISNINR